MSNISPKVILWDTNYGYVDEEYRKSVDRSNRKVMMGWTNEYTFGDKATLRPDQCKGNPQGRKPTQLFTNIHIEKYKYVKWI